MIKEPTPGSLGELGWRIGVALTAFNLVLLGIATTVSNPRAGRSGNLMFTLFAFVVYFNMLNIGQRWVTIGQVNWLMLMLFLHGSVFAMCALWLAKRHKNIHLRSLFFRSRDESPTEAAA